MFLVALLYQMLCYMLSQHLLVSGMLTLHNLQWTGNHQEWFCLLLDVEHTLLLIKWQRHKDMCYLTNFDWIVRILILAILNPTICSQPGFVISAKHLARMFTEWLCAWQGEWNFPQIFQANIGTPVSWAKIKLKNGAFWDAEWNQWIKDKESQILKN